MQVEDNLTQAEKQAEDHRIPNMRMNSPWSDAVTN